MGWRVCYGILSLTTTGSRRADMKGQVTRSPSKAHPQGLLPPTPAPLPKVSINFTNNALVEDPAYGTILIPKPSSHCIWHHIKSVSKAKWKIKVIASIGGTEMRAIPHQYLNILR